MKNILFILLLVSDFCFAQSPDTIILDKPCCPDSILHSSGFGSVYLSIVKNSDSSITITARQIDTVRVIMLVCDTSNQFYSIHSDTIVGTLTGWVSWQFGYDVRENNEHLYYLDENKKPLNKNIVVWQVK